MKYSALLVLISLCLSTLFRRGGGKVKSLITFQFFWCELPFKNCFSVLLAFLLFFWAIVPLPYLYADVLNFSCSGVGTALANKNSLVQYLRPLFESRANCCCSAHAMLVFIPTDMNIIISNTMINKIMMIVFRECRHWSHSDLRGKASAGASPKWGKNNAERINGKSWNF